MKIKIISKEVLGEISYIDNKKITTRDIENREIIMVVPNFELPLYEYISADEELFPEGCFGKEIDRDNVTGEQVLKYVFEQSDKDINFWEDVQNAIGNVGGNHEETAGGEIEILVKEKNSYIPIGHIDVYCHDNFAGKNETLYIMDATSGTQGKIAEAILKNDKICRNMEENCERPTICIENCYCSINNKEVLNEIVKNIPDAIREGSETCYFEETQGIYVNPTDEWKDAFEKNGFRDIGDGVLTIDFDATKNYDRFEER